LLQRLLFSVLVLQKRRIAVTEAEAVIMAAVIIISAQATDGLHP
jgi:hypothetical protein